MSVYLSPSSAHSSIASAQIHFLVSVRVFTDVNNDSAKNITTSITLTLLFRSVGAVVFGLGKSGHTFPLHPQGTDMTYDHSPNLGCCRALAMTCPILCPAR